MYLEAKIEPVQPDECEIIGNNFHHQPGRSSESSEKIRR